MGEKVGGKQTACRVSSQEGREYERAAEGNRDADKGREPHTDAAVNFRFYLFTHVQNSLHRRFVVQIRKTLITAPPCLTSPTVFQSHPFSRL